MPPGDADGLLVVLGLVVAVIAIFFLGWPLLLLLLDLIWLVLALTVGIVAKVLFRRPWRVEAISEAGARHDSRVVGFGKAAEARDELARSLEAGRDPSTGP
jgi:hypothetical protein